MYFYPLIMTLIIGKYGWPARVFKNPTMPLELYVPTDGLEQLL